MTGVTLVILLTICLTVKCATSKPIGNETFVEGVNFEYKDGEWICGDVKCPPNTFGCKIIKRNFEEDKKVLHQIFNCIDEDKNVLLGSADTFDLTIAKNIVIDLETYIGAISAYGVGFGSCAEQATGVVAVNELENLKENFRETKNCRRKSR